VIIIYSKAATVNALPPAPPVLKTAPEPLAPMHQPIDPAPSTGPGPVIKPEQPVPYPPKQNEIPQSQLVQGPNPRLSQSPDPLNQLAYAFQTAGFFGRQKKNTNVGYTPEQNQILERALNQQVGKLNPMTLQKFVESKLAAVGQDPSNAPLVILDTLRLTSIDFMKTLSSKLMHAKKEPAIPQGWQQTRVDRAMRRLQGYFDPKSETYVPSGNIDEIQNAVEQRELGPIEVRKNKAEAWNQMFQKVKRMTGIVADAHLMVDDRSPGERSKRPRKNPDGSIVPGRMGRPFSKSVAMNAWTTIGNAFRTMIAQHPDQAKQLGLAEYIRPGGQFYLSKAMVNPAEDNVAADLETVQNRLRSPNSSFAPKKNLGEDDVNNSMYYKDAPYNNPTYPNRTKDLTAGFRWYVRCS
jgi:hypothetical protein